MAGEDAIETFNVKGLDQLLKALKVKMPVARVGILGSDTVRESKPGQKHAPTNAEIGAAHEFGSVQRGLPARSFLRIPISENLEREMDDSNLADPSKLQEVIRSGSLVPWLKEVAIAAEACVSDAFDTGGNGKWKSYANPHYTNNSGQLLVDTKQLRESITSEVKE